MQTEVAFLGHIVGRAGFACDPEKLSAVRDWHPPGSVKQVRQLIGFVGYYRRFIHNSAELSEPLVALTRKVTLFAWTSERQDAFEALKSCLGPDLGFSYGGQPGLCWIQTLVYLRSAASLIRSRGPGGGDRICQPESSPVAASVLYYMYTSQNVSCCYDVYSFSFLSGECSVHTTHRPPVASKVLQ